MILMEVSLVHDFLPHPLRGKGRKKKLRGMSTVLTHSGLWNGEKKEERQIRRTAVPPSSSPIYASFLGEEGGGEEKGAATEEDEWRREEKKPLPHQRNLF